MLLVEHGSDEGLHHEVELAGLGQVMGAAVRADAGFGELVDAVALLAVHAVGHQVGELVEVSGGLPDLRMADDGRVQGDDVVARLHHVLPPQLLDGAAHREERRLQNIDLVDLLMARERDAVGHGVLHDYII